MSLQNEEIERILAWYQGTLPPEEMEAIQQKIQSEPTYKQEVEAYKSLFEGFDSISAYKATRKTVAGFEQKYQQEEVTSSTDSGTPPSGKSGGKVLPIWPVLLAVAASLAFVIVIGGNWWVSQTFSNEAIIDEYYAQPFLGVSFRGTRSGSQDTAETIVQQLQKAYTWEDTVQAIQSLGPQDTLFALSQFLLGHGYLKHKDYEEAVVIFGKLLNHPQLKDRQDNIHLSFILANIGAGKAEDPQVQKLLREEPTPGRENYFNTVQLIQQKLQSGWRGLTSDA